MPRPELMHYHHFTLPGRPNFLNEVQLRLTDESKKLFERGSPGLGYVGVVDMITGEIHLLPAFNKDDGQLRLDKDGHKFDMYASTEQTLGGGAGDLHTRTAAMLSLGDKAGNQNKLMGFGIWKAGSSVKFISELPAEKSTRLIRDEFLVTKNNDNEWKIYEVGYYKEIKEVKLNSEQLQALNKLPKDKSPEELTFEERRTIESILPINYRDDIKLIKNRSSSQNMFSCKYDPLYGAFFGNMMPDGHAGSHQVALRRELPLPVLEKIMDVVFTDLGLAIPSNSYSAYIPNDANDNRLQYHLSIEHLWIRFEKLLEQVNAQTNEYRALILKCSEVIKGKENFNQMEKLVENIEAMSIKGWLPIEMLELILKNPTKAWEIYKIFSSDFKNIIAEILMQNPQASKILIEAIDTALKAESKEDALKNTITKTLIALIENDQFQLTDDYTKSIVKYIVDNSSNPDDIASLLKRPEINEHLVNDIVETQLNNILREFNRSFSATEEMKQKITLLEKQGLLKSKEHMIIAHCFNYCNDEKLEQVMSYLRMGIPFNEYGPYLTDNVAAFTELAKQLVNKGYEAPFSLLLIGLRDENSSLMVSLKTAFPNQGMVIDAISANMPNAFKIEFGGGSESQFSAYFDPTNNALTLSISPPGHYEYVDDDSVFISDGFKEATPLIMQVLSNLGLPKETLDKVRQDLAANPNSYNIALNQTMQDAILSKHYGKSKETSRPAALSMQFNTSKPDKSGTPTSSVTPVPEPQSKKHKF